MFLDNNLCDHDHVWGWFGYCMSVEFLTLTMQYHKHTAEFITRCHLTGLSFIGTALKQIWIEVTIIWDSGWNGAKLQLNCSSNIEPHIIDSICMCTSRDTSWKACIHHVIQFCIEKNLVLRYYQYQSAQMLSCLHHLKLISRTRFVWIDSFISALGSAI